MGHTKCSYPFTRAGEEESRGHIALPRDGDKINRVPGTLPVLGRIKLSQDTLLGTWQFASEQELESDTAQ